MPANRNPSYIGTVFNKVKQMDTSLVTSKWAWAKYKTDQKRIAINSERIFDNFYQ